MRVCVVGLGAVGGLVAARLAAADVEVSALARGATLEAVRRQGLVLEADGTRSSYGIDVADDPGALGTPDLVVLSVKTPAIPAVAPAVASLLGARTAVLSATNGLPWWFLDGLPEAEGLTLPSLDPGGVADAVPAARVLGSVMHLSADTPEPGVVRHLAGSGIIVGEPDWSATQRLEAVARTLERGGFDVERSDRIQRDVWFKLWGNMTMNPLSAVTGATLDRILDDDLVRAFATRCMREAAAVGARIGLTIDVDPEQRHAVTRKLGAVRTSMLQDVERGRPVEVDALLTVVVELGQAVGVPTPELETLLGLTRLHARVRGLYPG